MRKLSSNPFHYVAAIGSLVVRVSGNTVKRKCRKVLCLGPSNFNGAIIPLILFLACKTPFENNALIDISILQLASGLKDTEIHQLLYI